MNVICEMHRKLTLTLFFEKRISICPLSATKLINSVLSIMELHPSLSYLEAKQFSNQNSKKLPNIPNDICEMGTDHPAGLYIPKEGESLEDVLLKYH